MSVQTETITVAQQQPHFVVFKSITQKAEALIEQMQKSELFDAQITTSWKGDFGKASFKTPEEQDAAALMLCYLLCEIVRPAITNANKNNEVIILHFENEIRAILQLLMPKDTTVDAYIEEFEVYTKEAVRFDQQCIAVDHLFKQKLQELDLAVQKAEGESRAKFEEHKGSLLESIQGHEECLEELHDAVDVMSHQMNTAHDELRETSKKMEALMLDVHKEQQNLQRVIAQGLTLLRGMHT